jgi:inosine-uridine nucleoside N-ribohydrolase
MNRRLFLQSAALIPAAFAQPSGDDRLRRLLEIPKPKHQVVIDTDTFNEIDDQYAVAYGILSPEHMEVEAVYAAPFHNSRSGGAGDGMEKSYQEILRILKFLGRSDRGFAYRGSEQFMTAPGKPVDSAAARNLIEKAMKPREKPLYVLTVGAPTNVASAILMEPKIKETIVVVWLGGATHDWPSAREFNLQQDIHSSRVLFDSGVALFQAPTINVTEQLRTTLPETERFLKGRSRLGGYLYAQFVEYYENAVRTRPKPYPWSKVIWDISTVAWLVEPKWVSSRIVPSPYLTDDFRYTQKPERHPMRVATHVNRDLIFFDLFEKLAKSG